MTFRFTGFENLVFCGFTHKAAVVSHEVEVETPPDRVSVGFVIMQHIPRSTDRRQLVETSSVCASCTGESKEAELRSSHGVARRATRG